MGSGMQVTAELHVVQRLRMSGATPLFPLCFQDMDRDNFTLFSVCVLILIV